MSDVTATIIEPPIIIIKKDRENSSLIIALLKNSSIPTSIKNIKPYRIIGAMVKPEYNTMTFRFENFPFFTL